MNIKFSAYIILFAGLAIGIQSCKKEPLVTAPPVSEFLSPATGSFFITSAVGSTFKIPVGVSSVSSVDRTITYTVKSPTGAASGSQYTLGKATVTIPAGKATDSIVVNGIFAGYAGSRVDTLIFTMSGGDVQASTFANVYTLVLRKSCDVIGANIIGDYSNSTDTYNGTASTMPNYKATISDFKAINSTSATVIIRNIGATSDNGWGPFDVSDGAITPGITATLNYADPANLTVTIATQSYFDGGFPSITTITGTGKFSSCDNTFVISCSVKYGGNGNTYKHVSYLNR
ncbi:MAG: hypothetical protein ABI151_11645 [Chitinophagaceae bacterium]